MEGLSRQITLYGVSKPREVRFGGYAENAIQISGMMFAVNYNELKIDDRAAWETIRIRGREIG